MWSDLTLSSGSNLGKAVYATTHLYPKCGALVVPPGACLRRAVDESVSLSGRKKDELINVMLAESACLSSLIVKINVNGVWPECTTDVCLCFRWIIKYQAVHCNCEEISKVTWLVMVSSIAAAAAGRLRSLRIQLRGEQCIKQKYIISSTTNKESGSSPGVLVLSRIRCRATASSHGTARGVVMLVACKWFKQWLWMCFLWHRFESQATFRNVNKWASEGRSNSDTAVLDTGAHNISTVSGYLTSGYENVLVRTSLTQNGHLKPVSHD